MDAANDFADITWPQGVSPSREFAATIEQARDAACNLFITGRAGTGKSTLLNCLRKNLAQKMVVLAPTGLAAVNVKGQTIHSFFGFPPQLITPEIVKRCRKSGLFRNIDTIVIDEVSMVRADLMQGMDMALRLTRKKPDKPFGGVQIIVLGDLHQLPPVVREREVVEQFRALYGGIYFFHAPVFRDEPLGLLELNRIFRQQDSSFIGALNGVREGAPEPDQIALLNSRVQPFYELPDRDDYVVLTPVNSAADNTNRTFLNKLDGAATQFDAIITGKFDPSSYPTDASLTLKPGSKIVLLRNDPDRRWVNGSQARITRIEGQTVWIEVNGEEHELEPVTWENIRYDQDSETGAMTESVAGSFRQLPIRLAWALTIHKSQGMTLDKAYVDFGRGTFAHGQAYVALSRARSLEGLALARKIRRSDVIFDHDAVGYRELFDPIAA